MAGRPSPSAVTGLQSPGRNRQAALAGPLVDETMSLKVFHIFFIALSILLALLVGGWGVRDYLAGGGTSSLVLGIFFFAFGFALLVYGLRFVRKVQELGI